MPLSPVLIYNTLFADRNKEVRKICKRELGKRCGKRVENRKLEDVRHPHNYKKRLKTRTWGYQTSSKLRSERKEALAKNKKNEPSWLVFFSLPVVRLFRKISDMPARISSWTRASEQICLASFPKRYAFRELRLDLLYRCFAQVQQDAQKPCWSKVKKQKLLLIRLLFFSYFFKFGL